MGCFPMQAPLSYSTPVPFQGKKRLKSLLCYLGFFQGMYLGECSHSSMQVFKYFLLLLYSIHTFCGSLWITYIYVCYSNINYACVLTLPKPLDCHVATSFIPSCLWWPPLLLRVIGLTWIMSSPLKIYGSWMTLKKDWALPSKLRNNIIMSHH